MHRQARCQSQAIPSECVALDQNQTYFASSSRAPSVEGGGNKVTRHAPPHMSNSIKQGFIDNDMHQSCMAYLSLCCSQKRCTRS
eukprot:404966-Amphidinium_carterae.3